MNILFGMGMFGVVGWSVAIPTLIGIGVGIWLDTVYESEISWTLTLMAVGIAAGAALAWYWIQTETRRDGR